MEFQDFDYKVSGVKLTATINMQVLLISKDNFSLRKRASIY